MTGIKINFSHKARLDFSRQVNARDAEAQNATVCFITERSPADMFATRGTTLFENSVRGAIVDGRSAQHACNFAALDTLNFCRKFAPAKITDAVAVITAVPTGVNELRLAVRLTLTATDGTTLYNDI